MKTIRQSVDPQSFNTWFAPIRPLELADNALTIAVPYRLHYEFLEEHYIDVLSAALHAALGRPGELQYRIQTPKKPAPPQGYSPTNGHQAPVAAQPARPSVSNPFVIPGVQRPRIESNLQAEFTFDNFVEGDCNSLARNAAKAVADNPFKTSFNPLVIHGPVGMGKTHLLQAIGNYITSQPGNQKTAVYTTTNNFTNQLISSIGNNTTNDLVNSYQHVDVLLVDDIQHLVGRKKTQDVFFNLFNTLRQHQKAVVMTCDQPIVTLDLPERLRSRFQWGLTADLTAPALETRMAIFNKKANNSAINVPSKVAMFICTHIEHSVRELEGVINHLSVYQGALGKEEIDLDLAKEVIKKFVKQINESITPDVIQRTVAGYYNLEVEKLASATRRRQVVLARQISMFLVKQHTEKSLKAIGQMFGGRDHSTVLYSIKTVRDLIETNDEIRASLQELERKIRIGKGEE